MWSVLINKPEVLLPSNKVVNNHLLRVANNEVVA